MMENFLKKFYYSRKSLRFSVPKNPIEFFGNQDFKMKTKEMINFKAQVSVFVIIAVILVAVGGIALFTMKSGKSSDEKFFSQANIKPELSNVKSAILSCRDSSIGEALDKIGVQGGYSTKPQKNIDLGWTFIPYYYDKGQFLMPSNSKIESELGKEIDKNLVDCIDKLSFNNFQITHGTSTIKATISKGIVYFNLDMSLSVDSDGNVISLEMKDASTERQSALFEILEVAKYITDSHKDDAELICATCLAQMAEDRDVYVNTFDLINSSVLVVISENHTSPEPYSFEFLNKYPEKQFSNLSNVNAPAMPLS